MDFKKPNGKKPYQARGRGGKSGFSARPGGKKPYAKRDWDKKPGEKSFKPRWDKPRSGDEKPSTGEYRPKKPYAPRAHNEGAPFEKSGFKKPYEARARDDHRPFSEKSDFKKPYSARGADERPRKPRFDGDAPRGDKKPYRKDFGDKKRFDARDDGRGFKKRDFSKPYEKRDRGDRPRNVSGNRDKKPFGARDEDKKSTFPGLRVAKVVARAGIGSRRDVEAAILDGRVTVNGKTITSPALNVTPQDLITLDGKPLPEAERTRLWLYHKPKGLVTTEHDPEGRATVFENLPANLPRVMSVGRLDINTEGLLLLTNDGGLKRMLELPTTGWLRRYRVRAFGKVKKEELEALKEGVTIDGVDYGPIEALVERVTGENTWLTIGIREGKNREIKNIAEHLGLTVNRLIRVSFGPFQLRTLEPSDTYEISPRILKEQLGPEIIKSANLDFSASSLASPRERQRLEKRKRETGQGSATGKAARYAAWQATGDEPLRRIRRDEGTQQLQLERKTVKDRKGRKIDVSGKPRKKRFAKDGQKPFQGKGRRSRPFQK